MSYTVKDTLGILTATVALAPVLFAPGYLAGWAFNLFDFRQRRPVLRLILGVPLTIAISPILVYLLARFLAYGSSTARARSAACGYWHETPARWFIPKFRDTRGLGLA
jgi:ABC-type sulfate transport system permease subunit